jgi:DNA-binding NarL/FixJ family response regulator
MQRVLFVDDEPFLLSGLRRMLRGQRKCWDMSFIEDPVEALEFLEREKVDVVVSDMRMPRVDGAQLLNRVREIHPETARLGLSGFSESSLLLRGLGSIHQYLSKPCESDRLVKVLESMLAASARLTPRARWLVASLGGLPCGQHAVARLSREIESPEPDLAVLQSLISQDLGLATKVLQLVHSSFFGNPRQLADVGEACQMLGVARLQSLLRQSSCFVSVEGVPEHFLINYAHQANLRARAQAEGSPDALVAFLRDIGQLVLIAHDAPDYLEMLGKYSHGPDLWAEERKRYGNSNPELANYLLTLWGFPEEVTQAMIPSE